MTGFSRNCGTRVRYSEEEILNMLKIQAITKDYKKTAEILNRKPSSVSGQLSLLGVTTQKSVNEPIVPNVKNQSDKFNKMIDYMKKKNMTKNQIRSFIKTTYSIELPYSKI